MITGEKAVIRSTDDDDLPRFQQLFDLRRPMAFLLDRRGEAVQPTQDELRHFISGKDAPMGAFFTVEDRSGDVRAFCAMRGMNPEAGYSEIGVMCFDDEDYATGITSEAMELLRGLAFTRQRLNKVLARCLDSEHAWRRRLIEEGFTSDGIQRDMLFCGGAWHDIETLSLFREGAPHAS